MRKKVISIILAAIMVVGMMPFGALAAGNVAKIDTTEYETLQAAVNAVKDGETIVLTDNVTEPAISFYRGYENPTAFTIDLNGKTWKSTNAVVFYCMYTDLTIIDSASGGVITNEGGTGAPDETTAVFCGGVNTQFHFNGGTIKNYSALPLASGDFNQKYDFKGSDVESSGGGLLIGTGFGGTPETEITAGKFTGIETKEIEQYLSEDAEINENGEVTVKAVCEMNGEKYPSLAAAVAAAPKDGTETTITMIANVDFGEFEGNAITIAKGQNIVLDLGEFTISGTGTGGKASSLIKNNGTLEIKGNGTLTYKSTTPDPSWGYGTSTIDNQGKLTLTSGRVENLTDKGASYAIDNNSNVNNVEFIFNGGTVACPDGDMGVRQFCNSGKNTNDFEMNGGKIESGGFWLQMPSGSAERNGTVTINNGEINGMVDICSNSPENTFVNINGGTLNISKLRIRDNAPTVDNTPFVNISGGTITIDAYDTLYSTDMNFLDITGGKIEDKVEGPNHDLWKQGVNKNCEADEEGNVTVKAVCEMNGEEYPSLAAAVAAAPAGIETTITLIADVDLGDYGTCGIEIPAGKEIILDLAGKKITGKTTSTTTSYLIKNSGTLTITDNVDGGAIVSGADSTWKYGDDFNYVGSYVSDTIANFGTLNLVNGDIFNNASGSACYAIENYNSGTLNVTGGSAKTAFASAIRGFNNTGEINISGDPVIESGERFGIQAMGAATKVNISGGTITGTYALATYNAAASEFDVEGGELSGDIGVTSKDLTIKGNAVINGDIDSEATNFEISGTPTINGGFTNACSFKNASISGGTFTQEVPIEYCAKGFVPKDNGDGTYGTEKGTLTNYFIDKGEAQVGGLMGRQYNVYDNSIGRAIIGLTTEQLAELNGSEKLVLVGGDYDKETTVEVDCAYTYFYNGEEKITAESKNVAAFVIIDADEFGGYISGYGYYRLYKDSAESEENFLFDTLFVNTNN